MADPRVVLADVGKAAREVEQRARHLHLTPFMRAEATKMEGEKRNWCPFGCELADLDDNGHCFHLIGFAIGQFTEREVVARDNYLIVKETADRTYEPMVEEVRTRENPQDGTKTPHRTGRLIVEVPMKHVPAKRRGVPDPPKLQKDDQLLQITSTYRVYRKEPPASKVDPKLPIERRLPPNSTEDDNEITDLSAAS